MFKGSRETTRVSPVQSPPREPVTSAAWRGEVPGAAAKLSKVIEAASKASKAEHLRPGAIIS